MVAISTARETTVSHPLAVPRLAFADGIRACAIFFVVVLHAAAPVVVKFPPLEPGRWWTANLLDSLARPCVPLFVMLSGLLLLDPAKDPSLRAFFARRFSRVVVPFAAWIAIYLCWRVGFHHEAMTARDAVRRVIEGDVYSHLWFVYMLLGLYLATPILRLFVRSASDADRRYFLLLWLVTVSAVPLLRKLTKLEVGIGLVVTTGFTGYFVLGYHLRDVVLGARARAAALAALGVLTGFTAVASWALSTRVGTFDEFFYGGLTFNGIGMSTCAFLLLRSLPYERLAAEAPRAHAAMRAVAETSFAIYLMHMVVLESILRAAPALAPAALHPLVSVPLLACLTVAVCAVAALGLRRVPYLRIIAP